MMNFLTEGLDRLGMKIEMAPAILGSKLETARMTRKYGPFDDTAINDYDDESYARRTPRTTCKKTYQTESIRNDRTIKRKQKVQMIKYGSDGQSIKEAEAIDYDDKTHVFDDIYDRAIRANSSAFLNACAGQLYDQVMDVIDHMSDSDKRDFIYVTACIQLAANKTLVVGKISDKKKKEIIGDIDRIRGRLGDSKSKPYVESLLDQSKELISTIEDVISKQNKEAPVTKTVD